MTEFSTSEFKEFDELDPDSEHDPGQADPAATDEWRAAPSGRRNLAAGGEEQTEWTARPPVKNPDDDGWRIGSAGPTT